MEDEDLPMASYSTGTMNSLLEKLAKMKNHSIATDLTEEFEKAVLSLKEDFFDKLAVPKVCMKQIRELVFEIEDWIDQKPETNMLHPSDIEEIGNFKTEIDAARARFTWYNHVHNIKPTEPDLAAVAPSKITINPRLLVEEKPCHGLLDGPRDELVKYLKDDKEEMRKVVSVVGMEGLGKTTLAREIYSELQLRFERQAFVSVGKRTPMRVILDDILRQVNPLSEKLKAPKPGFVEASAQEIITELWEYLSTKRYFIVVDGIWSTWEWKVINCALPYNRGSMVLTTTCIMDVGRSCCSYPNDLVYQMEALSEENSRTLFFSRIRILQEKEKGVDLEEASGYMLSLCGGIPLAIIVAAGLFARKFGELAELKMLAKSIHSSLNQYSSSDGMTKILHMSYADLSLPLRSCFLYLGVFLGNYTIKKDHLIWLWGAEGFIPKRDKESLWVIGETYFNELISRRLIQPVFTCEDDQSVGCTVHTVILDFVRSMSREENFATRATELNCTPFPCDTIRRFSLDCGNKDEAVLLSTSSVHLSSMRSLTVFGDVEGKLYPPDSKHGEGMHATRAQIVHRMCLPLPGHATKAPGVSIKHRSSMRHGQEMHATKAPGVSIKHQSSMRPVKRAPVKLDPPYSPLDDEMISDHQGLRWVSKYGEEMRATKAPGVSMNILSAFKLLRVLDLEDTKNLKNDHLKGIGGMVLLRYLGLAGTGITELPKELGGLVLLRYLGLAGTGISELPEELGGLEQLETLDLRRNTRLRTIAASIFKLQKLRHLLLPGYANEIWEMPELEVASGIRVESSSSLVELLKKCEQLRMLGLILNVKPILTEADLQSFVGEVVKSKLQSLSIDFRSDQNSVIPQLVDSWERVTAPLAKKFEPQRFEIRTRTEGLLRVPPNMGSLASLTHLFIIVYQAEAEDFLVLGGLTNLALLDLIITRSETERFIIKGGTFPRLKVFSFRIRDRWMGLKFEEGAMPQLQRFGRGFRVSERINQGYPDIGVEHLTCLTRVHATFNCEYATVSQVEALEAAIRRQVSEIASKPALELSREYETMMRL